MQTHSKLDPNIQGLPLFDWRSAVVHPSTRAGLYLRRRYRIPAGQADLIASLAGLGADREGSR